MFFEFYVRRMFSVPTTTHQPLTTHKIYKTHNSSTSRTLLTAQTPQKTSETKSFHVSTDSSHLNVSSTEINTTVKLLSSSPAVVSIPSIHNDSVKRIIGAIFAVICGSIALVIIAAILRDCQRNIIHRRSVSIRNRTPKETKGTNEAFKCKHVNLFCHYKIYCVKQDFV